jgi:hypothetical protein
VSGGPLRLRRPGAGPGARFRRGAEDPLAGVANLADLMLVFATGLLIALVLAWDLARALDPSLPQRLRLMEALRSAEEVEALERGGASDAADPRDGTGRFRSVGQVYQDTTTGRMFVVEEPR